MRDSSRTNFVCRGSDGAMAISCVMGRTPDIDGPGTEPSARDDLGATGGPTSVRGADGPPWRPGRTRPARAGDGLRLVDGDPTRVPVMAARMRLARRRNADESVTGSIRVVPGDPPRSPRRTARGRAGVSVLPCRSVAEAAAWVVARSAVRGSRSSGAESRAAVSDRASPPRSDAGVAAWVGAPGVTSGVALASGVGTAVSPATAPDAVGDGLPPSGDPVAPSGDSAAPRDVGTAVDGADAWGRRRRGRQFGGGARPGRGRCRRGLGRVGGRLAGDGRRGGRSARDADTQGGGGEDEIEDAESDDEA